MGRGAGATAIAGEGAPRRRDPDVEALTDLTEEISDRIERELGYLDSVCAPASAILAAKLRERGLDARVECGIYLAYGYDDLEAEPTEECHAYVRLSDLVLDPTRGQFDEGEMVTNSGDPQCLHTNDNWGIGLAPPRRPTIKETQRFIEEWWTKSSDPETQKAALLRVLAA